MPFVAQKGISRFLKEGAISLALAVGLLAGAPALDVPAAYASPAGPVVPDLAVLISGPPIKDPGALLRNALPINNKAIREVQKPLEDITESLKVAGVKALDSVERVSIRWGVSSVSSWSPRRNHHDSPLLQSDY